MLSRHHILYNNRVYHQMSTHELTQMSKTQRKIITYSDYEDLPGTSDPIFNNNKSDCVNFELHRRQFVNCLIQLASFHKVNDWVKTVQPLARCRCCRPDYYEYMLDCARVLKRQIYLSLAHKSMLETHALAGGRVFFTKRKVCKECKARVVEIGEVSYKDAVDELGIKSEFDHEGSEAPVMMLRSSSSSSSSTGAYVPTVRNGVGRQPVKRRSRFRNLRDSIILATYRGVAIGLGPFPQARLAVLRRMREREERRNARAEPNAAAAQAPDEPRPPHPEDALEKAIREGRFWTVNIMKERAEAAAAAAARNPQPVEEEREDFACELFHLFLEEDED